MSKVHNERDWASEQAKHLVIFETNCYCITAQCEHRIAAVAAALRAEREAVQCSFCEHSAYALLSARAKVADPVVIELIDSAIEKRPVTPEPTALIQSLTAEVARLDRHYMENKNRALDAASEHNEPDRAWHAVKAETYRMNRNVLQEILATFALKEPKEKA